MHKNKTDPIISSMKFEGNAFYCSTLSKKFNFLLVYHCVEAIWSCWLILIALLFQEFKHYRVVPFHVKIIWIFAKLRNHSIITSVYTIGPYHHIQGRSYPRFGAVPGAQTTLSWLQPCQTYLQQRWHSNNFILVLSYPDVYAYPDTSITLRKNYHGKVWLLQLWHSGSSPGPCWILHFRWAGARKAREGAGIGQEK